VTSFAHCSLLGPLALPSGSWTARSFPQSQSNRVYALQAAHPCLQGIAGRIATARRPESPLRRSENTWRWQGSCNAASSHTTYYTFSSARSCGNGRVESWPYVPRRRANKNAHGLSAPYLRVPKTRPRNVRKIVSVAWPDYGKIRGFWEENS
jgi:hypothetical protein